MGSLEVTNSKKNEPQKSTLTPSAENHMPLPLIPLVMQPKQGPHSGGRVMLSQTNLKEISGKDNEVRKISVSRGISDFCPNFTMLIVKTNNI